MSSNKEVRIQLVINKETVDLTKWQMILSYLRGLGVTYHIQEPKK